MAFINLYFDIVESHRRELEESIRDEKLSAEEIAERYSLVLDDLAKTSDRYFSEVERGNDIQAMTKWNEQYKTTTEVDNMAIFNVK